MTQKEDNEDKNGGRGGVYYCRFYDKAGYKVGTGADVNDIDPHEHHMDHPNAFPVDFAGAHNLYR